MTLTGKVALVTGGSRGLGRGIALALAKAGAKVLLTYRGNAEAAARVCEEIRAQGGGADATAMELQSRPSIAAAFEHLRAGFGAPDILVNNAAISQEKPFEALSDEDWDRMLAVNLGGPFRCTQLALPKMLERGFGRIINVSSIGGQWGGFNQVHYAAAKAALINFTRSLARLYSAKGVTANAIAPGLVATDMSAQELASPAGREKARNIPAQRLGTVDEVGAAAVFLAGEDSGYLTGQTLNLNGGMYFG
jgi:acetoacetyl-CoA reductase/3-oxoacyl-[acyl-carrier protein] reductase